MTNEPLRLRDIMIVGGGCYGTFYAGQLLAAVERGKLECGTIRVVDRNPDCQAHRELAPGGVLEIVTAEWDEFLDHWLAAADPADTVVPSPLMPHLMSDWLLRRARTAWPGREIGLAPVSEPGRTPFDQLAPDGTRYLSHADWLCPVHCIEPAICPVIKAPRAWQMEETVHALAARLGQHRPVAGVATFFCRHRIFGVGMFGVDEAHRAEALLRQAGESGQADSIVVATVSGCHGAVSLLNLGALLRQSGRSPPADT
ncbi:MAG TPA: hypothetical protein VFS94_00045 [Gemmatimonadales bacterium]|nr:hypothetical protein [Gemmatimonadales bacterium]